MTDKDREQTADEKYMRRCIELALCAEGQTSPNPMVGAVIVCDGRIIGEGWHHRAGEPHAEVNAVRSVSNTDVELLRHSTIYVSLEPCAHYGRTPPCAELIVRTGFKRVVVGCKDTFSKVSGRGIDIIRKAGIEVTVGILENECRQLNRRFFCYNELRRPYVTLKWAQSADGYIGLRNTAGQPMPTEISDIECRRLSHRLRATNDAILVGATTVAVDNPSLTTRLWTGKDPIRLVIDPNNRIPSDSKLLTDGGKTIVFGKLNSCEVDNVRYVQLTSCTDMRKTVINVLKTSAETGIQSVVIEGGKTTLQSFIDSNVWDEAYVFCADKLLFDGVVAPKITTRGLKYDTQRVGNCALIHIENSRRE